MREVKPPARRALWLGMGALFLAVLVLSRFVCLTAWIRHGILVPTCPAGQPRQTLFVVCQGLRRDSEGSARVGALAVYTTGATDEPVLAPLRRFQVSLTLVKDKGGEVALAPVRGWRTDDDHAQVGGIVLPRDLPDGDYLLRARVHSPLGDEKLQVPLAVYAPARIHVITDRPIYEPGNTVRFRAVVLRASDLGPVDGRPGKWVVQDPSGETALEERAPAGQFGVVSGSFPLDRGAPTGDWQVRWLSGGAEDVVHFRVAPFTLPRFGVDATAARPFYRAGERPLVRGKVTYTSGAPVRGAALAITWTIAGDWPPPRDWQERALPKTAGTDDAGAFELALPVVPRDLRGRVSLSAQLSATDATGDRVAGQASVLLTEHDLQVSAVTELEDGLVAGFNNRVYLRATSPSGAVLAGAELRVKRAWEPNDPGVTAVTDEDGVAALQLDPGPPVNVVVPAMPVRPASRPPVVARGETRDLASGGAPELADQLALDRLQGGLAPCARFVAGPSGGATIGARVNAAGALVATSSDGSALAACLAAGLAGRRLAPGHERLFQIQYSLAPDLPRLTVTVDGAPHVLNGLVQALEREALDARSCLPLDATSAVLPRMLTYRANPQRKVLSFAWVEDWARRSREQAPAAVMTCLERKLRPPPWSELGEESAGDLLGVARFDIEPSSVDRGHQLPPTTLLGYELSVAARRGGEDLGSAPLIVRPGTIPPIRLRASPVLGQPGGDVDVTILRGPGFEGALPAELSMTSLHGSVRARVNAASHGARFKLPGDAQGWWAVTWNGARALVYVRPASELAVEIHPRAAQYAPGQKAELAIQTRAGKAGTPAAVGLFGVDASLAELATLPSPDDMTRLRPRASMTKPAFGVLDVGALEMGRLRGANAASATVLRVTSLPDPAAVEATLTINAHPTFDAVAPLTESFYNILGELQARVRQWEEHATPGEQMRPPLMAAIWTAALDACDKRKESVADAWGRRLRLSRLPGDLLALTDPRTLVVNGTRLPEDVEDWAAWVRKERP